MKLRCIVGLHRYAAASDWFAISSWQTRKWLKCADCGKRKLVG